MCSLLRVDKVKISLDYALIAYYILRLSRLVGEKIPNHFNMVTLRDACH